MTFSSVIDHLLTPALLYSLDAVLLRSNSAFGHLTRRADRHALLRTRIDAMATRFGSFVRDLPASARRVAAKDSLTVSVRTDDYKINGVLSRTDVTDNPFVILVYLQPLRTAIAGGRVELDPLFGVLSPREQEVAMLLARGHSNREIATLLAIAEHTARRHTERVLERLGLTSRQQIAPLLFRQHPADDDDVIVV